MFAECRSDVAPFLRNRPILTILGFESEFFELHLIYGVELKIPSLKRRPNPQTSPAIDRVQSSDPFKVSHRNGSQINNCQPRRGEPLHRKFLPRYFTLVPHRCTEGQLSLFDIYFRSRGLSEVLVVADMNSHVKFSLPPPIMFSKRPKTCEFKKLALFSVLVYVILRRPN